MWKCLGAGWRGMRARDAAYASGASANLASPMSAEKTSRHDSAVVIIIDIYRRIQRCNHQKFDPALLALLPLKRNYSRSLYMF